MVLRRRRSSAEQEIESPQPRAATVRLRQAHVPRHRQAERERQAELVDVLVQGRETDGVNAYVETTNGHARQIVEDRDEGGDARSQHIGPEQRPLAVGRPRDLPDQPHQHEQLQVGQGHRPGRVGVDRPEAARPGPEHKQQGEKVKPGQRPDASSCDDVQHTDRRRHESDQPRDGAHDRQLGEHVPRQDEHEAPQRPERHLTHRVEGTAGCVLARITRVA